MHTRCRTTDLHSVTPQHPPLQHGASPVRPSTTEAVDGGTLGMDDKYSILLLLISEFSFRFSIFDFPNLPITHCGQCVLSFEGGTCRRTVPAYLYGRHTRVISILRIYQRGSNRFLLIDSPNRLGSRLPDFHAVYITESRPPDISKNLPAKDRILLPGISILPSVSRLLRPCIPNPPTLPLAHVTML